MYNKLFWEFSVVEVSPMCLQICSLRSLFSQTNISDNSLHDDSCYLLADKHQIVSCPKNNIIFFTPFSKNSLFNPTLTIHPGFCFSYISDLYLTGSLCSPLDDGFVPARRENSLPGYTTKSDGSIAHSGMRNFPNFATSKRYNTIA